jgi:hypothetical protein
LGHCALLLAQLGEADRGVEPPLDVVVIVLLAVGAQDLLVLLRADASSL